MASELVGESNGHEWIKADWLKWVTCRKCGIIRKTDDSNKPCPGIVGISLRETHACDGIGRVAEHSYLIGADGVRLLKPAA